MCCDFNVKGKKYLVFQGGELYSEYMGDGKDEQVIYAPTTGSFMIREKVEGETDG